MLGATTFGTMALSADEPKSRRKVRIGVEGGNFGAAFQWHQHPNCVVAGVTDLRLSVLERRCEHYGPRLVVWF
jgi:hypothetical protein